MKKCVNCGAEIDGWSSALCLAHVGGHVIDRDPPPTAESAPAPEPDHGSWMPMDEAITEVARIRLGVDVGLERELKAHDATKATRLVEIRSDPAVPKNALFILAPRERG